jgi:hypothetical protein
LRAGAAAVTGGAQLAGGIGLGVGPVGVNFGASLRTAENGTQYGAIISVLSIH